MANAFNILNIPIGDVAQSGKTYATAPTPPAGDDSTKIATTAFVADKTATIPSGNVAIWSRDFTYTTGRDGTAKYFDVKAPVGGSWFCWGRFTVYYQYADNSVTAEAYGGAVTGGATVVRGTTTSGNVFDTSRHINNMMAIKIA